MANNYCGCSGNGDTPEYIIRLNSQGPTGPQGPQGEQGFSPIVSYTMTKDDIHFTIVNEDNIQDTPNFFNYVAKKDLSNVNFANPFTINGITLQEAYPTNNITSSNYLYVNSPEGFTLRMNNTGNHIRLSGNKITDTIDIGGFNHSTILVGLDKAYYNGNEIATVNDISDVSDKLDKDGLNADNPIVLNAIRFYNGTTERRIYPTNNNLRISGNPLQLDGESATTPQDPNRIIIDNNIITIGNTNRDNVIEIGYTNATYKGKEISTVDQIPIVNNPTVTLTQGGETKGTFTLNQTNDVTIDLEEGGDTSLKLPLTIDGDPYVVDGETRIPFIKLYKTQTTQGIVSGTKNSSGDELNSASMVITSIGGSGLSTTYPSDNVAILAVNYDNNTIGLNSDNKLAVIKDYITNEKYGIQGDYSTHYGILDCPNGLIDYNVTGKDITINAGMILQLAGQANKTTIASNITKTLTSNDNIVLFYSAGEFLEAGKVDYSIEEPADNGASNYQAWYTPEVGQWQFKSNDTGNVWRQAIATPIANIYMNNSNITRIDYIGYRILDDDIFVQQSELETINESITTLTNDKADKATTLAGYGITDAYDKDEIDSKFSQVPDMSDVYTTDEIDSKLAAKQTEIDDLTSQIEGANEEIANLTAQYNSLLQRVIALETNINGGNA